MIEPESVETRTQRRPGLRVSSLGIRLLTLSADEYTREEARVSSTFRCPRWPPRGGLSSLMTFRSEATALATTAWVLSRISWMTEVVTSRPVAMWEVRADDSSTRIISG